MLIKSIIIEFNGLFREVIYENFIVFFQIYRISCLVQLLRIRFHKMLHFTIKFLALFFKIYRPSPSFYTPPPILHHPSPVYPALLVGGGG